jgi:hypothetical protein
MGTYFFQKKHITPGEATTMKTIGQAYKHVTITLSGISPSRKIDQVIPILKWKKKALMQLKKETFGVELSIDHSRSLHLYRLSQFETQKKDKKTTIFNRNISNFL